MGWIWPPVDDYSPAAFLLHYSCAVLRQTLDTGTQLRRGVRLVTHDLTSSSTHTYVSETAVHVSPRTSDNARPGSYNTCTDQQSLVTCCSKNHLKLNIQRFKELSVDHTASNVSVAILK